MSNKHDSESNYTFFADEDEAFSKMRNGFDPHVTYPCGVSLNLSRAVPREGAMTWHCGLCIQPSANEAGMYEKCHDIIDLMTPKEACEFEIGNWYYGHTNKRVNEAFDDELLRSIGLARNVDPFPADPQFVQTTPEPEILTLE